jgi:hypothetical protein
MSGKTNTRRVDDLLASVTDDLLGDLPQAFQNDSLRVEREDVLDMMRRYDVGSIDKSNI